MTVSTKRTRKHLYTHYHLPVQRCTKLYTLEKLRNKRIRLRHNTDDTTGMSSSTCDKNEGTEMKLKIVWSRALELAKHCCWQSISPTKRLQSLSFRFLLHYATHFIRTYRKRGHERQNNSTQLETTPITTTSAEIRLQLNFDILPNDSWSTFDNRQNDSNNDGNMRSESIKLQTRNKY